MGKIRRAMKNGRERSDYSENFVTFVSSRESHEGHSQSPTRGVARAHVSGIHSTYHDII